MATPRRTLANIAVKSSNGESVNRVNVDLFYSKGGMNYFSYTEEKRGYWVSVTPQTVERGFVSTTAFSGTKQCIEEVKRFGQKKFDNLEVPQETIDRLIEYVIEKNNLVRIEK